MHLEKVPRAVVGRTGWGERANAFRVGRNGPSGRSFAQVSHHVALLLSAEHKVHMVSREHLLRLQLRVATRHNHEGVRVLSANASDQLPALLVRKLRHGASVHHADVGLLPGAHASDTVLSQFAPDGGRLGEIEFAAQRVVGGLFIFKICTVNH